MDNLHHKPLAQWAERLLQHMLLRWLDITGGMPHQPWEYAVIAQALTTLVLQARGSVITAENVRSRVELDHVRRLAEKLPFNEENFPFYHDRRFLHLHGFTSAAEVRARLEMPEGTERARRKRHGSQTSSSHASPTNCDDRKRNRREDGDDDDNDSEGGGGGNNPNNTATTATTTATTAAEHDNTPAS